MGKTVAEKILARASGRSSVSAGEVVWVTPDLVTTPEVSFAAYVDRIRDVGVTKLADAGKVVVVIDHEFPAQTTRGAERNARVKALAKELSVQRCYEGDGISHPLVVEEGLVSPGMFVLSADTHTTALGGVGALAIPLGYELTMVLALGRTWVKVPESVRIEVTGTLSRGVTSRDVVLAVIRALGSERADYRVLEYAGPGLAGLSIEDRMTICNLTVDIGAKSSIAPADGRTAEYFAGRGSVPASPVASDPDARYAERLSVDLGRLEPLVAAPPSPENVQAVSTIGEVPIDHGFIGSCASGTIEHLRAAASILRGRKIHRGVCLLVSPSTRRVYAQAVQEGLVATFLDAGALVSPPTCGPCFGGFAQLAPGETRISTSTRNDPGRMGSKAASIYLGSAMTVAASAVAGRIADPREFAGEEGGR